MRTNWMLGVAGTIAAGLLVSAGMLNYEAAPRLDDHIAADEAEAADETTIHIVERGDLLLRVERDGRIESAHKHKVRISPEAYSGILELTEVLHRSGPVEEGDILFRIDDSRLEENFRQARETLENHHERLKLAVTEHAIIAQSNARRIEQAENTFDDAKSSHESWVNYQGPRMLQAAELSFRSSTNNVLNQREELAQLEMMYEGTELATETKEIVLDRARRSLSISEGWLALAEKDRTVTVEYNYPRQDRTITDNVRFREQELEHLRVNSAIAEARKATEILGIERSIRDATERLEKLESDRERLTVRALASGLMTSVDLQPGDTVSARQVITEILDPSSKTLRFNATAADLRILREGAAVQLTVAEFPELSPAARVIEIAHIGQAAGDATHFPVLVEIQGNDPQLRLGLRGRIVAERTLDDLVLVPRSAVTLKAGRATVRVQETDDAEAVEREITIGASNDEFYHVVSGLSAGDRVVLKKKKE